MAARQTWHPQASCIRDELQPQIRSMRTPAVSQRQNGSPPVGESPAERVVQVPIMPEIQEDEEIHPRGKAPPEKIYVAVGKDMVESVYAVRWALQNLDNIRLVTVILLHVRATVRYVPSPMGRIPVNQVSKDVVAEYMNKEEKEINNCMKKYLEICSRARVKAEPLVVVEKADVSKGIVEAIAEHGIVKLIIATTSTGGTISKKMKGPGKADYVQKHALESCEVSIVCKGKLVLVSGGSVSPSRSAQKSKSYRTPISDWLRRRPETPDVQRSSLEIQQPASSTPNFQTESVSSVIGDNPAWPEEVSVRSGSEEIIVQEIYSDSDEADSPTLDTDDPYFDTRSNVSGNSSSIHIQEGSEDANTDIESLKLQLREALQEAEEKRREMQIETVKRTKAEVAAIKAIKKFKECEAAFKEAARETEDSRSHLRLTKQKCDETTRQRDEALLELQSRGEVLRSLETKVNEISRQRHEKVQELEAARTKLAALESENFRILQERNVAIQHLHGYLESRARIDHGTSSSSANIQFTEHSFDDIVAATCNFNDYLKLGEGGYGVVFKGEINQTTVAIKILREGSLQGQQEFQREIHILRNFRHPHLVSIVGACFERGCILYEYMSNGCLGDRLFCKNATPPLPWHARFRIAAEVCSALQFLHTSKPNPIVHRDLKPENILLDENLVSKISDFGLARAIQVDFLTETGPKGTFVYMDPEYLRTGEFTPKSDVYSLGVVILQLLTGKPAFGLVNSVETALNHGQLKEFLDPSAGEWPFVQTTQLAYLALHCTEQTRNNRPDLHPTVMNILDTLRTFAVEASNPSARPVQPVERDEDAPVPSFFLCPIFKEVMLNPHVAADGFTYEMEGIMGWLDNGHDTSPMTNLPLAHKNLIPNHSLRSAIRQWQEKADFL